MRQFQAGGIQKKFVRNLNVFFRLVLLFILACSGQIHNPQASQNHPSSVSSLQSPPIASVGATRPEYLWIEAENMRGFTTKPPLGEPMPNPSYLELPRAKAPGWGINGPGVSAEWSQGGESEWNSAAASADETSAVIYQDLEIPAAGEYKAWVRYADWSNKTENFVIRITQSGNEVFRQEFGTRDVIDRWDEVAMYWRWAFAWDGANTKLSKGPAQISIEIQKAAEARRHIDCLVVTNDLNYVPEGRRKPDFYAMRYLREWSAKRSPLSSLLQAKDAAVPTAWRRPKIGGRDFLIPWNITPEFWKLYDQPAAERPLYPFNAEPVEEFVKKYKGARDVPIFSSKLLAPVIYINHTPELLGEGSAFLRYVRETKTPFAIKINYGSAQLSEAQWKLLTGELKDQFLGWISGESVGYVWNQAPEELHLSPSMTRGELLEAHRIFYNSAIAQKWSKVFQTPTDAMWEKLIPAQSTSSTSFAHALTSWGVRLLGIETAAVQPMFAMRTAFTRGAARQFGGSFLYYHAPNFGDTATTFTRAQNFAGPANFFHSRYGATMGPSLSWYRKSYYFYYMSGASAIYLEQGADQFFKPGPGGHEFQLNPLGRITTEFVRFAERHPDPGVPYTPVAFLLDPAHGWEMTDHPHWPFEVSQINRSDRALRELFGVAYYPGLVVEGEPATGDRQAFVNGIFGDIFDALVAADIQTPAPTIQRPKSDIQDARSTKANSKKQWDYVGSDPDEKTKGAPASARDIVTAATPHVQRPPVLSLDPYRAIVLGGHLKLSRLWIDKLTAYVRRGGTLVINASQIQGVPEQLLGVKLTGSTAEADNARCHLPGEGSHNLGGQMFRYEKVALKGAKPLITSDNGDTLVSHYKLGEGSVIFSSLPDLLGADERITPFAAHMLTHVFADATPVKVEGDVEHLINRTDAGWVVTLLNNNGVFKPQQGLAQVDRSAYVTATLRVPSQRLQKAFEWISDKPVEIKNSHGERVVNVSIAPGGISIIELQTGP